MKVNNDNNYMYNYNYIIIGIIIYNIYNIYM